MKTFLTVLIPCYNEEKNLGREVLATIDSYLRKMKFSWEVLISDDGSTDISKKLIKEQIKNYRNFRLIENPHGGKPSALWYGIQKAKGRYILFADMDQSTAIDQLEKLLPFIEKNVGVVIGSRGLLRKNFPLYRRLGSIIFITFRKLLILPEINDTQCGFKLFDREVVKMAFPNLAFFKSKAAIKGWSVTSFDVELLHVIKKMGKKIEEVPVIWEDKDVSESKGAGLSRYVKESKEMLTQILKVKVNDLLGRYKV